VLAVENVSALRIWLLGPAMRTTEACGLDVRDLEADLVRLDLAHGRVMADCPGGRACPALRRPVAG
jgi:hypothetical protein